MQPSQCLLHPMFPDMTFRGSGNSLPVRARRTTSAWSDSALPVRQTGAPFELLTSIFAHSLFYRQHWSLFHCEWQSLTGGRNLLRRVSRRSVFWRGCFQGILRYRLLAGLGASGHFVGRRVSLSQLLEHPCPVSSDALRWTLVAGPLYISEQARRHCGAFLGWSSLDNVFRWTRYE